MKKIYRMENLCCANCAAKMEAAIEKLEGVLSVTVNFMAQRLVLEAEDDRFADVFAKAVAQKLPVAFNDLYGTRERGAQLFVGQNHIGHSFSERWGLIASSSAFA